MSLVLLFERHATGSMIHNYGEAQWSGVVTITTVGYGDQFPCSAQGQGIAVVLKLAGIGLIAVHTAAIARYFIGGKDDDAVKERTDARSPGADRGVTSRPAARPASQR